MKKLVFVSTFLLILFLPLSVLADGKRKSRNKSVGCNKLKGKAKQRCVAKAAALAEQRRREAARRAEHAAQAQENRFRALSAASIKRDNLEGENLEARKAALEALNGKAGTVVTMESNTGKIVSIVNQEWAIKQSFKPCSTIKLVTAIAGVQEHVMDEEDDIEGVEPKKLVLRTALSRSNNPYFNKVGAKIGNDKFVAAARSMGLGKPTGLNVPGEASGQLPYVQRSARQYSFGDGTEVTALQLAILAAGIANGGRQYKPTIVKPGQTHTPVFTEINVPKEVFSELVPGMKDAAESGTARRSGGAKYGIAGKTGTCSDDLSRIGLFTSFAPIADPKYTVVVIIRGRRDQTNGPFASFIAGKVYDALLGSEKTIPSVEVSSTISAVKQP